jgi:O-antigen ligase
MRTDRNPTMRPARIHAAPVRPRPIAAVSQGVTDDARAGLVHRLILAAVWLTFATSGIVFSEPAPVDVLMMGLIILLPVAGLTRVTPRLAVYISLWGVVAAAGLLASAQSLDLKGSTTFTLVSVYLYAASFVVAAFIAVRPGRHMRLILGAWLVAGMVAAMAGLVGYFGLVPGAFELFTKFDRLAGTFKDPNVMGPFLVAPFLYALHLVLHRPAAKPWYADLLPLACAALLALAVLLTFSRGAWLALGLGLTIYAGLSYATARSARERDRIALAVLAGTAVLALVTLGVLQDDRIANVLRDRATLTQSYDVGPEGRFGGQQKAFDLLIENPLGIGAGQFASHHHYEDVHNVYLSVFLNNGWLGGFTYWLMTALTLGLAAIELQRMRSTGAKDESARPYLIIAISAFAAIAVEGLIVDTDHWRSYYVLMAMVWGLCADTASDRQRV